MPLFPRFVVDFSLGKSLRCIVWCVVMIADQSSFQCCFLLDSSLWLMYHAGICQWLLKLVCVHDKDGEDDDLIVA
ncbi:hypothetical protein L6164_004801 [Bauhinia variegata]|uniref:Uncharacterized protein n=1 Tax=Bauhinia variegata TaxID=167791 RepID=A0ACB9PPF2_BAUVA|nr:hypothetical protein L6164_004801 [Bauhinia variegata]